MLIDDCNGGLDGAGRGIVIPSGRCSGHPLVPHFGGSITMSVAKVTEISAEAPESFEDALQVGIARASKTIDQIKGAWINEQSVVIENGKITTYRVNLKLTFVLKD